MEEQHVSNIAFRGSITQAITLAKKEKKLFVVYVSGDNEESASMDESTWPASRVSESLSKYCVLLHLLEGSTDVAQLSAIYPQKSAPCITVIGYNGAQLWQNEGFVSEEVLASTLEKAWLSLHVQETTATFLTAALASRQSEQIPSEAPATASREVGSSSATSSNNTNSSASLDKKDVNNNKEKSENHAPVVEGQEMNSKLGNDVSHGLSVNKSEESNVELRVTTTKEPVNEVTPNAGEFVVNQKPSLNVNQPDEPKPKLSANLQTEKIDIPDLAPKILTDIYLNIRLPGGLSLQQKFELTSTLRMVKDYVDEKQGSSIGSYDLAIPYPRKVFSDQDLSKTLKELNLLDRQALIVVPHLQASSFYKGRSFTPNPSSATGSSDGESYFSLVKRYLSYVNPLAYLGGAGAASSSTSGQETTRRNMGESGAPEGNFTGSRRSYLVTSNQSSSNTPSSIKNKPSSSRFGSGSNIHKLKHDEDDTKFSGRNAFWNGNSTEFGGDGDK